MRPEEIERFFAARVVGPDAMAMAIHERAGDRLVGTCAFCQLDGDNGSALYHITIGEKDAWGQGYGTEATRLMLDHAFGTLGLHRVALYVFEFNERAIRAYRALRVRPGGPLARVDLPRRPWWDELAMSVLESDWRRLKAEEAATEEERARLLAEAAVAEAQSRRCAGASREPPTERAAADHPEVHDDDSRQGPAADAARADVRELIAAKGHTVDNARAAVARLTPPSPTASLQRTPAHGPVPRPT